MTEKNKNDMNIEVKEDKKEKEIKDQKMKKEVKDDKKYINNNENEFKKITELTEKEIEVLPKVPIILYKRENKRYKTFNYGITVKINDLLKLNISITETRYNLIKLKLKLDMFKAENTIIIPCRLVTGLRKDDSVYHQIEMIIAENIYESYWFKKDETELLQITMPNLTFIERPERIDNLQLIETDY